MEVCHGEQVNPWMVSKDLLQAKCVPCVCLPPPRVVSFFPTSRPLQLPSPQIQFCIQSWFPSACASVSASLLRCHCHCHDPSLAWLSHFPSIPFFILPFPPKLLPTSFAQQQTKLETTWLGTWKRPAGKIQLTRERHIDRSPQDSVDETKRTPAV
ncbi:hypothetical protein VTJ49DRAFT_5769 [Mycothermus thermophilus]|uniref:Uncharacterized protein n=1 Tax=Humicola insolens TaxID=85995 RepID=A0ABR3VQR7_HUMIN